jgi:hypothetical protein
MKRFTIAATMLLSSQLLNAAENAEFAERWKASELAGRFFGPEKALPKALKTPITLGGGINASLGTKIECGNIDVSGSIKAEIARLDKQFGQVADQIKNISPTSLAVLATCYYKPSLCAYIKHASVQFNEYLNLQADACRSIDSFIDEQADKGMKAAKADAVAGCIKNRGGNSPTTEDIRVCQSVEPATKNLLSPFKDEYIRRKQEVLKDTLKFVSAERDYNVLASLLGEVEIREDGFWRPLYPKGLLKGSDAARNLIVGGQSEICDLSKLKTILASPIPEETELPNYVKAAIKDNFLPQDLSDLESLPQLDQKAACHALGGGVAEIAIRRIIATAKSSLSAALTNPALNEDIRTFYKDRSAITFATLHDEISAKNYPPLTTSLERMRTLAAAYRDKNRESASTVSAGKVQNESSTESCDDEISCKR